MTEPAPEDDSNAPSDFTSQISETLKLGSPCNSGSFGVVYRRTIKSSKDSMEVAVKVFKIDPGRTMEKIEKTMRRELLVWLRLKHSTIVPLLGTAKVESPFPALISKWMSSGTLYMYLEQVTITVSTKIELAIGIADGLNYLHSENVIHGDLHPANVLIDDSGNPRLTDFGLATVAGDAELQLSMTTVTRTLDSRWRAPEIVGVERDPEKPSFKSDIYALGGVMLFIISGDVPWKKKNSLQICIALSHKVEHPRPDNIIDYYWILIKKCWSWDPWNRPDAAEVIECITPKNIIIFGERGSGKSSVINLLAGRQVAETSSGQDSLTLHYDAYGVIIDDIPYRVYDTTGFDDYRMSPGGFLYAITNAHKLAKEVREKGGVYLLLYCIKGEIIPSTCITNYRLLYEVLFEKVPVALVATHLEGEDHMDDWYARNKEWFESQAVKYVDHACITATDNPDPKCREKYEMSRTKVGKLISRQVQNWNRGDWSHARAVEEVDNPSTGKASKADVLGVLTKRCGLGESLAKAVIRNLAPSMAQSTIRTIPPEIAESTIRTTHLEMTEDTISTTSPEIVDNAIQTIPPEMAESTIQTIRPEITESTIRITPPEIVDSTIQASPPEMAESTIQTIHPKLSKSIMRTTAPDMAESTTQTIPPKTAASIKHGTTSSFDAMGLPDHYPRRCKTIVLFGETGVGKSSLINLMADKEIANTSPDMQQCTFLWKEYTIGFDGDLYTVFETIGLDEPQLGIKEYLESMEYAYRLIRELDERGGIDLLLFCVRARFPGITATTQSNYRLFNTFLCEKKVPIVLAITNLEREKRMEDWWERNHGTFDKYQIQVAGHACITAANRLDGRHKQLYEESRITIRNLVKEFTADELKRTWKGGNGLFVLFMRRLKELLSVGSHVRRKDLVPRLTKRCAIPPDIAKQLANMIKQDVGW